MVLSAQIFFAQLSYRSFFACPAQVTGGCGACRRRVEVCAQKVCGDMPPRIFGVSPVSASRCRGRLGSPAGHRRARPARTRLHIFHLWCLLRTHRCTQHIKKPPVHEKPTALKAILRQYAVWRVAPALTGCVLPARCPWVRFCWAAWLRVAGREPHRGFLWAEQGGRPRHAE